MHDTVDIDKLRSEFTGTLGEYMREGAAMCTLLREPQRDPENILLKQQALNAARERYEAARSRYVCAVLGEFITPRERDGDTTEERIVPDPQ